MTTTQNQIVRARYDLFRVGAESDFYRMRLGNFIAGDSESPARDFKAQGHNEEPYDARVLFQTITSKMAVTLVSVQWTRIRTC